MIDLEVIKLVLSIVVSFFSCYKFLQSQLDKKADTDDVEKIVEQLNSRIDREVKFIKESVDTNQKNFSSKLDDIKSDMRIIKEFLLQQKK